MCTVLLDSTTYSILVLISLAGEGTVFNGQGIESTSDNCDYRYGNITLIHCLPGLPRSELHLPQGLHSICFSCCSFSSLSLFPRGDVTQVYVQPSGSRRLLRRSLALLSESNNRDSPALIIRRLFVEPQYTRAPFNAFRTPYENDIGQVPKIWGPALSNEQRIGGLRFEIPRFVGWKS